MVRRLPTPAKLILDFAPLAVFFVGYKLSGVMAATTGLIIATVVSLAVIYLVERKLAIAPLITGLIVAIFGGLTLALNNEEFIKLKPTFINLIFAAILLTGVYGFKRGILKHVLDVAIEMSPEGWLVLSKRWGFFFLFLAALNEVIWRNFPTSFWVDFKVFGMFTLTIAFALAQFKLIEKYATK